MQVVCGNCQLSFQVPDGATGLVCPICRSPLRASGAAPETNGEAAHQVVEWSGGTLDDLVALLSGPAWSARVEVFPVGGGEPAGEVHVIAGGVSEAIHDGKSTHDALDKLRAVKSTRFRIEPRLPNPSDGDLTFPGPSQGKLEERPLAHLMRYCEDYVLTTGIEVWRGSENAKVDYRRGEIVGVTVGGIDAPERLAEVMKWASGSYRLIVPKLTLPETAPPAAIPATVVPSRAAAAASKTIFGMPALDPGGRSFANDQARSAQAHGDAQAKAAAAVATATAKPSGPILPPGVIATPVPAPPIATGAPSPLAVASAVRSSVAKTIFGVAPAAPPPAAAAADARQAIPTTRATTPGTGTAASPPATEPQRPERATAVGGQSGATAARAPASARAVVPASSSAGDQTLSNKIAKRPPNETPVWTYVGVGFIFGMALLGVYRLVMVLAH
jgi:hypothetical protein